MPICPPSLALRRIDPEKNVAPFYALAVERDLFGRTVLVREWGRIGTDGRRRHDEHKTEAEAFAALAAIGRQKRRRGYR
jgi:predicted DNA-binding WGR domain protein